MSHWIATMAAILATILMFALGFRFGWRAGISEAFDALEKLLEEEGDDDELRARIEAQRENAPWQ
jgi:hypothetical protein